jgi:excisionase family DNA binding protein
MAQTDDKTETKIWDEKPKQPIHLTELPEHRVRLMEGFPKLSPEAAAKEKMWTPADVANYLNVSVTTITKWTMKRMIPAYRIGDTIRYRIEEIMQIAKANMEHSLNNARQVNEDRNNGAGRHIGTAEEEKAS